MFSTNFTLVALKGIYAAIITALAALVFYSQYDLIAYGCIFGWILHWTAGSVIVHRYITHRTFKLNKLPHIFWCYVGNLILVGSTISWASMHRTHHQHADEELDPHSPSKYSAFKLFFLTVDLSSCDSAMLNSKDLIRDKTLRLLHKYYLEVAVVSMLIMLSISWQVLAVYCVGVFYTLIGVFFSVYPYHKKGRFNYINHDTGDSSNNNLWSGIFFHGEAYHNNHHNNPGAISNAEKWFEWDANKWFINLIRKR